jgi:hypothetical protein
MGGVSAHSSPRLIDDNPMWKILIGFVAFAALALFVLSKSGDVNLSGESHSVEAPAAKEAAPAASAAVAKP